MIRTILFAAILMSGLAVKAQTTSSFGAMNGTQSAFKHPQQLNDTSNIHKKWFVTKYAGVSSGFVAFKGGSSSFLSVPLALQVNRQLTNNLYAFGSVSIAPYIFRYNSVPYQPAISKNNSLMQTNNFTTYSDAKIGLMYINNEKTFSISGSIGVSRGSYNSYSPFYTPVYTPVSGNTQY
ncbi:hypothetical protein GO495_13005 [Chitinophaga oryziterrae]|uniref:Uncharacterized protein n=1 Tax=Chitinophaga oryziterrae TaxID=1031224 RepID=A0A6N8J897_9BACT|nr:hypothetical protein [Chitinophaga oryziterrae]MVT41505.1 hypothetical protein [Chitinophaga oryziterrae]